MWLMYYVQSLSPGFVHGRFRCWSESMVDPSDHVTKRKLPGDNHQNSEAKIFWTMRCLITSLHDNQKNNTSTGFMQRHWRWQNSFRMYQNKHSFTSAIPTLCEKHIQKSEKSTQKDATWSYIPESSNLIYWDYNKYCMCCYSFNNYVVTCANWKPKSTS